MITDQKLLSLLLGLYKKSITKKAKFNNIMEMMEGVDQNSCCLDIGSDNGILSYLLRENGGSWHSADLDIETVNSIESVVSSNVAMMTETEIPHSDNFFDCIIIIDLLEHLKDENTALSEIQRVLKPGGLLIANVPHTKKGSVIRALRLAVGLTDEKHGHVRPGYNLEQLSSLLGSHFVITKSQTYSRFFTELIDILLSLAAERSSGAQTGRKGVVMTSSAIKSAKKALKLYTLVYPLIWFISKLDLLIPFTQGHSLIIRANSTKQQPDTFIASS